MHFCTGRDTSMIRTSLGYEKTKTNQMHEIDAYCIGLCFTGISDIVQKFEQVYQIKQFRRQDRSLIKYLRADTKHNYPAKDCKVVKSNGLVFL